MFMLVIHSTLITGLLDSTGVTNELVWAESLFTLIMIFRLAVVVVVSFMGLDMPTMA